MQLLVGRSVGRSVGRVEEVDRSGWTCRHLDALTLGIGDGWLGDGLWPLSIYTYIDQASPH